jgi:hypothetical protein
MLVQVRARNTGSLPWRFNPMPGAGTHLWFVLRNANGGEVFSGKTGLRDAQVQPGATIDLELPLPAFPALGQYWLVLDMVDEQHGMFFQMGSEPLELRLDVRE